MSITPAPPDTTTVHVSGRRPTAAQLAVELRDLAVALPLFLVSPLVRHWHRRWGATDAEVVAVMPGDELVPGCRYRCTRAITIQAPPATVWAWLVQVGFGKAGFYANDLLDNVAHPSAERILAESPDRGLGATRLVTRLRILYRWKRPLGAIASLALNELGDFPMMRRMLLNLKRRAEGAAR